MDRASTATIQPHQRRQQKSQLETEAAGPHGPDVVAGQIQLSRIDGYRHVAALLAPAEEVAA